jgi:hypothetical protein
LHSVAKGAMQHAMHMADSAGGEAGFSLQTTI